MSAILRRVGVAVSILVLSGTVFGQILQEPSSMRLIAMSNLGLGFGARALSMGGAYAAVAEGLEAVGYNPAGLARITAPEFIVGGNLSGQTVRFPPTVQGEYDWYSWPATGPRGVHSSASGFDHAGAAVRVKAGPQTFVIALSFHREIFPRPLYEYSADFGGPDWMYSNPNTYFIGTLAGTGTYRAESDEWLGVYTGSVAFRIARNVFFGVNVNLRRGEYRTLTVTETSFGIFDQGAELVSARESLAETRSGTYSNGFSIDAGVLWQSRLLSLAAVYMSGFHLARLGTSSREESVSDSTGWSYDLQDSGGQGLTELWPGRFVAGAALRPVRSLTISGEIVFPQPIHGPPSQPGWTTSDKAPGFEQQYRMGLEYVLTRKSLAFPLRAGWALLHSNLYAGSEDDVRISAWTLGTGLHWRNFTFDIGALFHFASVGLPSDISSGPMKRTYWDAFLSLGYALKRNP